MPDSDLETEGNKVSTSFHPDAAAKAWREIVESSGLQDQELADAAGMSKGHFSKVSSGQQGDLLGLVLEIGKQYPHLRRRFITRLAELEEIDPLEHAAEQAVLAAVRLIRVCRRGRARMAKAGVPAHIAAAVNE